MRFTYPQPGNDDEFEDFCVRYYRHLLKRDGLVRYGKRGEKQDGIDVIDQFGMSPLYAIQCKHREPRKKLSRKEIEDEVHKASLSNHRLDHFIIATTAKKSRETQDVVIALNQSKDEHRPFLVEIQFWEEICTRLCEFGRAIAEILNAAAKVQRRRVAAHRSESAALIPLARGF